MVPTDEAILAQESAIKAASDMTMPLGELEPVSALADEYAEGGEVFQAKISQLADTYVSLRRTRGDGNCFFRAFLFSFLHDLLDTSPERQQAAATLLSSWHAKLVDGGFQELVFEDALEALQDLVQAVSAPDPISVHELLSRLGEHVSSYCIMLLRMIASCECQRRAEHFAPFVASMSDEGDATVEQFCRRRVEPMGVESDHLHIVVLTDALQTPMRIVYLDNTVDAGGAAVLNHHDFKPEACAADTTPCFTMLYRPGHYDLLNRL